MVTVCLSSCSQLEPIGEVTESVDSAAFRQRMEVIGGSPVVAGCSCQFLKNGDVFFPSMLTDIRAAKHSITLETFIIREGTIANTFVSALAKKAEEGLEVCVLLDGIGSRFLDEPAVERLKSSGVKLEWYRPLYRNPLIANNRTHRKLLILDGKIGHVGGAGFANAWKGNGMKPWYWRDNQYRFEGPVVAEMQKVFCENWQELTGDRLKGRKYFPKLSVSGVMPIQHVASSPHGNSKSIGRCYLLAIEAARTEVCLSMAYVCPPPALRDALERALRRGVKVRIVTSSDKTDSKITRRCSHHLWKKLIPHGLEVYEYQPSMMHAKLMVVDRYLVIGGAANFDYRSCFINDENNFHVFDQDFAEQQVKVFNADMKHSKKITMDHVEKFSLPAWLIGFQL